MKEEVISIKGVSVCFDEKPILEDVNLSLKDGDYLAIIGPNGSGKTTLLKVILGLIKPDKGEVRLFGMEPQKGRRFAGYLPQHSYFDPGFPISVFDAVLMGRYGGVFAGTTQEDRHKAEDVLQQLGILDLKNRQIGSLSGGQLQRVLLARALVREPRLLLLDEPTASIDPETQVSFYKMLDELKERMTIVMVSHDIGVVFSHVNEVACLNRRLFYHGPVEGASKAIEEMYCCPIELVGHGLPHRVLREH